MLPSSDPRTEAGSHVCAKARLVTHEREYRRQFGDKAWKKAVVEEAVVSCELREKNGKKFKFITADWQLIANVKRATLYIGSEKENNTTENYLQTANANLVNIKYVLSSG